MKHKLLLGFLLIGIFLLGLWIGSWKSGKNSNVSDKSETNRSELKEGLEIVRASKYKFTKPLLFVDQYHESTNLQKLKFGLASIVHEQKRLGKIDQTEVYFKELNTGYWFDLGMNQSFPLGSLTKVPVMMTILKMAEKDSTLLKKELELNPNLVGAIPNHTYEETVIKPGRRYTVQQLLESMIENSDNYATYLLTQMIDVPEFQRLFTELELPKPSMQQMDYALTASQYSRFLRVLYNASYLSPEYSNRALELMSKCSFNKGITRNLSPDIQVAHKFGEYGMGTKRTLSESAILYLGESPYLLTIMTKGDVDAPLEDLIASVSSYIYTNIQ